MLRAEKEKVVEELVEKFQKAQGVYLADYRGLDVAAITELRRRLRSADVEFLVVKNTLAKLAVDEAGIPELKDYLVGPTSLALGYEDPIEPARLLVRFHREHERPHIRSGLLEGKLLTSEEVAGVAILPSKDELLAKVASLIQSPLVGFVYRCQGLLQKFVATLDAYRQKKGEDASGEEVVGGGETSQKTKPAEVKADQGKTSQDEDPSEKETVDEKDVPDEEVPGTEETKEKKAEAKKTPAENEDHH